MPSATVVLTARARSPSTSLFTWSGKLAQGLLGSVIFNQGHLTRSAYPSSFRSDPQTPKLLRATCLGPGNQTVAPLCLFSSSPNKTPPYLIYGLDTPKWEKVPVSGAVVSCFNASLMSTVASSSYNYEISKGGFLFFIL